MPYVLENKPRTISNSAYERADGTWDIARYASLEGLRSERRSSLAPAVVKLAGIADAPLPMGLMRELRAAVSTLDPSEIAPSSALAIMPFTRQIAPRFTLGQRSRLRIDWIVFSFVHRSTLIRLRRPFRGNRHNLDNTVTRRTRRSYPASRLHRQRLPAAALATISARLIALPRIARTLGTTFKRAIVRKPEIGLCLAKSTCHGAHAPP